jgi:hypothetical protein
MAAAIVTQTITLECGHTYTHTLPTGQLALPSVTAGDVVPCITCFNRHGIEYRYVASVVNSDEPPASDPEPEPVGPAPTKPAAPAARKTATCRRCRATLTSTRSVANGIGPVCARNERREQAAQAAGFKQQAIDKARALIAEKAILPLRGRRVFTVVSSNGVDRYLTAPSTCNCPAGLKGRYGCYHRAAATMLAA